MRQEFVVLAFLWGVLSSLEAKDLGTVGATFEIAEPCLIERLQNRMMAYQKSGKLEELQKVFERRVVKSLERPRPVSGLQKARKFQRRFYDPTLTLTSDYKDLQGRVFGRKGQQVNPLEYISFGADMIFFDGDDPEQVAWAKKEPVTSKWVLVRGAPFDLQNETGRPVYFDQGGLYTEKFGIKAIPARLRQEGKRLVIEEITLEEKEN
tara:strand:+ start:127 stop:750 length:624 start_codon:yes stop_codon:yes gene_type:complete